MLNVHTDLREVYAHFDDFDKVVVETFKDKEGELTGGVVELTLGDITIGGTLSAFSITSLTFYRRHTEKVITLLTAAGIPFSYY